MDKQYAEIDYHGHHISVVPWHDEYYPGFWVFVDGKDAMTAFGSVDHAVDVAKEMIGKFGSRLRPDWGILWQVVANQGMADKPVGYRHIG